MYAGVICTVAEVLGGALPFATFDVATHYPLVTGADGEVVARTRGPTRFARTAADSGGPTRCASQPMRSDGQMAPTAQPTMNSHP